ncbi:MAG: hypothetical protein ACREBQ_07850, partial [Nitrososphaerales archaeon]
GCDRFAGLQPQVVPVSYEVDGQFIYFSGYNLTKSPSSTIWSKTGRLLFVVDALASIKPWRPPRNRTQGSGRDTFRGFRALFASH